MPHRTPTTYHHATKARFLTADPLTYSVFPDEPKKASFKGDVIGNVCGHFGGLEVYIHPDETCTIVLRAEFVSRWERVPLSAVEFENLETRNGAR